ncbi:MAG: ABC transporter permease [Dethiobacter sp.]|nr:ABC transporter permease [Dethiobacter sp.]
MPLVRKEMGLHRPIYLQYFHWLAGILRGDFGESFRTGRPVWEELTVRLPATLELALAAMLVSLVIAIPAGIISAVKQYSLLDNAAMLGAMIGVSMPNFWLGLLLSLAFSLQLDWLPVFGRGELRHLVLPALTLGTGMAAVTTRLARSSILEVLRQDYIRTARAKGLTETMVTNRHVLKNSLIPVITIVGLQFGALLEGVVVVEIIFAWPGIGRLLYDSIFARDYPVIQGCVFLIAVMYVMVNLLVDISYAWLDPRIRYEVK